VLLEDFMSEQEMDEVRGMIQKHVDYTGSPLGKRVLADWKKTSKRFTRVIPKDYKKMLQNIEKAEREGLEGEQALMAAFEMSLNN
jgi:glutamate synthase domain-containing protein 3